MQHRARRTVVATRTYKVGRRALNGVIYKSRRSPEGDWTAEFRVTGLDNPIQGYARGIDALQALLLAAQALRLRLESLGLELSWLGGEVGDTGIPRVIPASFGLAFSKYAERLLDGEVTKCVSNFVEAQREVRQEGQKRAQGELRHRRAKRCRRNG